MMQKNYRSNVLNHFQKYKQQEEQKEQEEKENRLIVGKENFAEAKENDANNDLAMVDIKIDTGGSKEATITTNIEMISTTKKHRNERTVLIIDDNEFCREFFGEQVREILSRILKSKSDNNPAPFVVDIIGDNVQESLEHLLVSEFDYDLVLVDMNMPGSPPSVKTSSAGLYLTKEYKLTRPDSLTKFVCVSGLGRDEELQSRCRAVGMVPPYSLGKPFDRKELLDLLTKTFGHV